MTWWKELFYGFNATIDPKPQQPTAKEIFIGKIEALGYKYDNGNDWYERTWSTDSEPKETIREVFQQLESGKWHKLMIGYGDQIFYEEDVNE